MRPGCLRLGAREIARRAEQARAALQRCRLCGHACGADRLAGELGRCGIGPGARVASVTPHFGEEPVLSGTRGAGNVFFSGCSLRCAFCQNWPISQRNAGVELSAQQLADKLLGLQRRKCHNINLVTATHQIPAFLQALALALEQGLALPIVHNSSGFDSPQALELLEGIVDVYLPDIKYDDPATAARLSGAANYVRVNRRALRIMYQQVGRLRKGRDGLAQRGLIVRHLVLPNGLAGERGCFRFLARLDPLLHVALMSQYFPANRAGRTMGIRRRLNPVELETARAEFFKAGLGKGWIQDNGGAEEPAR